MSRSSWLILVVFALLAAAAAAQVRKAPETYGPANLAGIVDAMERAQMENQRRSPAYTVTREYRLYQSGEESPTSEVVVSIAFKPPNEKTFTIDESQGSDRVAQIVRNILESEVETARKLVPTLSRESYDFSLAGEEWANGRPCWVLNVKPKHPDKSLIDGKAWVDKHDYQIQRVEGDLSKSPSWWLKKVHLTTNFGAAGGLWLQQDSRAVAEVRMFGSHTLIGESLNVRTAEQTARASQSPRTDVAGVAETSSPDAPPKRPRHTRREPPVFGTGVLTSR